MAGFEEIGKGNDSRAGEGGLKEIWQQLSREAQGAWAEARRKVDGQDDSRFRRSIEDKLPAFDSGRIGQEIETAAPRIKDETRRGLDNLAGTMENLARDIGRLGEKMQKGMGGMLEMSPAELKESFEQNVNSLDSNHDGFVTREEMVAISQNFFFRLANGRMLAVLDKHYDTIQSLSNDELGLENSGITTADVSKIVDYSQSGTGSLALTRAAAGEAFSLPYLAGAGAAGLAGGLGSRALLGFAGRGAGLAGLIGAGCVLAAGAAIGAADFLKRKDGINRLLGDLR